MVYSFIIPAFNRPDEIQELLTSFSALRRPEGASFEIFIVDGSPTDILTPIIAAWTSTLTVQHIHRPRMPISPARNLGAELAHGDYLIFLDSDVILPRDYLVTLHTNLLSQQVDAFGGPDAAHESFTDTQKAISFAMTSYLTTGGIRGGRKQLHAFHPRGFNMGVRRSVFQEAHGYSSMTCGEDIDLSIRLIEQGRHVILIPDAFVYHKRRSTFKSFFRQVFRFGAARINLFYRHRRELKITHLFPAAFLLFLVGGLLLSILFPIVAWLYVPAVLAYYTAIFLSATVKEKSLRVGVLGIIAATCQLCGYGSGFLANAYEVFVLKKIDGIALGASK